MTPEYRKIGKYAAAKIERIQFKRTNKKPEARYLVTECRQTNQGEYYEICTRDRMQMFKTRTEADNYIKALSVKYHEL